LRAKLKELRLSKKFTQNDMAVSVGISRSAYTNIETGTKNPSLTTARKIKDILKYEKDDIFFEK
jgi:putative transcriptional regulator